MDINILATLKYVGSSCTANSEKHYLHSSLLRYLSDSQAWLHGLFLNCFTSFIAPVSEATFSIRTWVRVPNMTSSNFFPATTCFHIWVTHQHLCRVLHQSNPMLLGHVKQHWLMISADKLKAFMNPFCLVVFGHITITDNYRWNYAVDVSAFIQPHVINSMGCRQVITAGWVYLYKQP